MNRFVLVWSTILLAPISEGEKCIGDCAKAFVNHALPLLGSTTTEEPVTIYLSDESRTAQSDYFSAETVLRAVEKWKNDCKGNHPGIPQFIVDFEKSPPENYGDFPASQRTIVINFRTGERAPHTGEGTEPAFNIHNTINVYERCPLDPSHHLECAGKGGYIRWDDRWGAQAMAHEIGHVLGLAHDDGSCLSVMSGTTAWKEDKLVLTDSHCDLASRLNDIGELCANAPSIGINNCERCKRKLGGSTDGLAEGDRVTVAAEVSFSVEGTGTSKQLRTTAYGIGPFEFGEEILEGSTYSVTVEDIDHPDKSCTITQGATGTVGDDDIDSILVVCQCDLPLCGNGPTEGGPDVIVRDLCDVLPDFCGNTWFPWWRILPGPGTGHAPCQRKTTCTDVGENCNQTASDGTPICSHELECVDSCAASASLALSGPATLVSLQEGSSVSGLVRIDGFARDQDGLQSLRFYLDGEPTSPDLLETGLLRGDSCTGVEGDCDPFSGFVAEFDSRTWTDGAHELTVAAVDGKPSYPMLTRVARNIVVDNVCSSASSPSVALTAPANGARVSGLMQLATSTASEVPVERVQFYVNGSRIGSDWAPPFEMAWDSSKVPDGFHQLRARAVDECGSGADSQTIVVEIVNQNDLPGLEVEEPLPGATLWGTAVPVSGWAVDGDGIKSIALRLNGQVVVLGRPVESRSRSEVCSSTSSDDPRCPDVGWATTFDSTAYPDGSYTLAVVATDGRGGARTVSRQIEINNDPPNPPGVSAPTSLTGVVGETVVFQVHSWGEGTHSYQWQIREGSRWHNLADGDRGGRVTGVHSATLTIQSLEMSDAGGYRCRVMNEGGTRSSPSASLTVVETIDAPTVISGIDQSATEGGSMRLSVSAEGAAPLIYQWQKWTGSIYTDLPNGGRLSGVDGSELSITEVEMSDAGTYRCLVSNAGGTTPSSGIDVSVAPDLSGSCVSGSDQLCLLNDRFQVETVINGVPGRAKPFSNLGGFFTRANTENLEVGVKVLDGVWINGRYWVFHGSMTSLPYTVTVTDTVTGASKSYYKDAGSFCGSADTSAFANPTGASASLVTGTFIRLLVTGETSTASCQSTTTAQCLLADRFRVQVFRNGVAQRAVPVTGLSAAFTFGSTANPEVMVKVLDGTPVNDWYWVFFGSLTDQAYEVRVTDTTTGEEKTYPSPGASCGLADTSAF